MCDLSVIILTHNEQVHIARCIQSVRPLNAKVFVVDCGSQDNTVEIARSLGAHVYFHEWCGNSAQQLNWALGALPITTEWVFRLDADEWVSPELATELNERLAQLPPDITGIVVKRQQYAFGRRLRWGGHPIQLLRCWRRGASTCEQRWMDEHMLLSRGSSVVFQHSIADQSLKPVNWWMAKHVNYAVREAADVLLSKAGDTDGRAIPSDAQSRRKRWLKQRVYARVPRFCRPFGLFSYRYFLQLGILDGLHGLAWHTLQGFCYRFLVDTILYDVERRARVEGVDPLLILRDVYGLATSGPKS
jgi:glycosyltransferase involved in cell wall biosynthesis